MRVLLFIAIAIVLQIVASHPLDGKRRFDNYTVYRVIPKTENGLNILVDLQNSYDFWTEVRSVGVPVDIMVPPNHEIHGNTDDLSSTVMINNVQETIDNEGLRPVSAAGTFDWKHYHTLDEVNIDQTTD